MTYAFVRAQAEEAAFPITVLCDTLGVSTSGYYEWLQRGPSQRSKDDAEYVALMTVAHEENHQRYGRRRHQAELQAAGKRIGPNRTRRLMREGGLWAKQRRRFVVTTKSDHDKPVAPNELDRNFHPEGPNQAWVGDITYIPTRDGWLYLAIVLDLYSRRVVGWATSSRATRQLALDALQMALQTRAVEPGLLLFHSDRGVQYASDDFVKLLKRKRIKPSMSRRANCWDNAVAESFFATLEKELLVDLVGWSRDDTAQAVFAYIGAYYNGRRRHSTLDYQAPAIFEAQAIQRAAWQAELARKAA